MDKSGKGKAALGYARKPRGRGRARSTLSIREPDSGTPIADRLENDLEPLWNPPTLSQPLWTPPTFTEPRDGDDSDATLPPESQEAGESPWQEQPSSSRASAQPEVAEEDEWVVDADGRRFIEPLGNSFKKATVVCRTLYKIVNNHWGGPFTNLTEAPEENKRIWWSEFERKYYWAPEEERTVRKNFYKKVSDHMRNVINKAKTSRRKPPCINDIAWELIKDKWNTPAHKEASERARSARTSSSKESGTGTYAGGSITIAEHKRKMAKETGTEPHFMQLYDRVYTKKDKSYVSDRAKALKDKFVELTPPADSSGGDGSTQGEGAVTSEAVVARRWLLASSAVKPKGRVYGWGSLAGEFAKLTGTSSSGTETCKRTMQEAQTAAEMKHLKAALAQKDSEIAELREVMTQTKEEMTQAKEEMNQTKEEMNRSMQAVLAQMNILMAERKGQPVPAPMARTSLPPPQVEEADQDHADDAPPS